ncbi:MAG: MBL fold metallo-hydrolase [Nitrospirae bacterium]|nr:MAG: MBL fold metallo-hydrolase [Nitrospirota bacterium]
MRLTVLGSGTNMHPKRAAAGYLVETDQLLLFDFGPRTLMNLIKAGVDRHRLRHLFLTHHHTDHFADFFTFFFDALFHAKFVAPRPALTIYGPRGTRRLFGALLKAMPGFAAAPFRVTVTELTDRTIRIGRTRVTAGTVVHSPRLHCQGYRVEHGGVALAYSGDAEYCEGLIQLCRGADVAVLDCSFPVQRPGPNHMTARDCGRAAREAGVKRLLLSHFYPVAERYDVKAQAGREFGGRITLAKDRMRIEITRPSRASLRFQ